MIEDPELIEAIQQDIKTELDEHRQQ
jgi:hypothetical protein